MAFDAQAYLAANPDVAASGMSAEYHYQNFGQYEGRDPGGATSGAQTNYWDSQEWLAQPGNGGGTRATGIQSSSSPVTVAGNLPNNASFYNVPAQFEGKDINVGLTATSWANVQKAVADGMDFNEAVLRNSGDGIGTRVVMPGDSGYLPYGIDVTTGQPVYGGGSGASTGATVGTAGAGGSSAGAGTGSGSSGGLSLAQQALLKALMDQQEMDGITGEMRNNASELYDRTQNYETDQLADIATFTGGNSGIYSRYQPDIDNDVGTAVADARAGQTAALNTAARQALRYGVQLPSAMGGVSSAQASQLASAANTTRNNAIDKYRGLAGQGIGLKDGVFKTSQAGTADAMGRAEAASMAGRNMRIQNESLDWAKQLDVTGMARGMPGASQGAYGVAVGAGNSAVQNQMAPGQALIGAMGQSNNTTMQGQQLAMNGTLGVLNAQSSYANAAANSGGSDLGGLGSLLGGGVKLFTAFGSDRRLKENIELVGRDERTGLNLYEFSYIDDPDQRRFVGVMSDEVRQVMPSAVTRGQDGLDTVDYARLGIEFKEVA